MWNSKPKKTDCGCSGHTNGNPKISHGPCYGYGQRPAVRQRIAGKRLAARWLAAARARHLADVDA
jgi:hypothetical protein